MGSDAGVGRRTGPMWDAVAMSEASEHGIPVPSGNGESATGGSAPSAGVESLVPAWVTIPELAERYDLKLSAARRMVEDRHLVGTRVGERRVLAVPEGFLGDDGPLPELQGTFTVLADGRMGDVDIIRWLHTPDPTLPVAGSPLDAIRAGFAKEVRRRAMEQAL
jgi:hypothetical protein